jgi:5-methylcytosine-specific restriction endonuclease McrA
VPAADGHISLAKAKGASPGRYNLEVITEDRKPEPGAGGTCGLCGRFVGRDRLTRHHLLPRSQVRRMRRRKMARRELKRRDPDRTVDLCRPCHGNVHASLSNGDLGRMYDSLEALSAHPDVRKFTDWVRDKPHSRVRSRRPSTRDGA